MFISFEGIDNSGKTTQIQLLERYLLSQQINVLCVREPGGCAVSEQIRNILLDNKSTISEVAELLLFEAARTELINQVILPALNKNIVVLSDRFVDSTIAYQGYGRGLDLDMIRNLNQIASRNLVPDITFYLRIDIALSKARRSGQLDRIEQVEDSFIERTMAGFDMIAKLDSKRVVSIDASQSQDVVSRNIIEALNCNTIFRNLFL